MAAYALGAVGDTRIAIDSVCLNRTGRAISTHGIKTGVEYIGRLFQGAHHRPGIHQSAFIVKIHFVLIAHLLGDIGALR